MVTTRMSSLMIAGALACGAVFASVSAASAWTASFDVNPPSQSQSYYDYYNGPPAAYGTAHHRDRSHSR